MKVKVCDFQSEAFETDFVESLKTTGFAVVTNHGIDYSLIRETQNTWKRFFKNNQNYKDMYINAQDANMGYTGMGGETGVGAAKADLKEFYHWKPGQIAPDQQDLLTQRMFFLMEDTLAPKLLKALNGIGSEMKYDEVCKNSNNTVIRMLYYPALDNVRVEPGAVRSASHEDINFLTLLVAATSPGLQVKDLQGNWHDVPFEENSIIVNVGDMLAVASNGYLKSTTHRVVNPDDVSSDRISIPLFIHANGDTELQPGLTAQSFLNERLNAIYKNGYTK